MTDPHSIQIGRAIVGFMMKQGNDLSDDDAISLRLKSLANWNAGQTIFNWTYNSLIARNELVPLELLESFEYKKELWGIACEFMPATSSEKRVKFCRAIMACLWCMNN